MLPPIAYECLPRGASILGQEKKRKYMSSNRSEINILIFYLDSVCRQSKIHFCYGLDPCRAVCKFGMSRFVGFHRV